MTSSLLLRNIPLILELEYNNYCNESVRVAAGLRLGAAFVHPYRCVCVCDALVLADGHHGLACRKSAGRHSRHNQINDIVQRAFSSASVLTTREPLGLCPNGKRPDGITTVPWQRGRCLAWDATCPDTFAPSHLQASSIVAGAAAAEAETKKKKKNMLIRHTTSISHQSQSKQRVFGGVKG